MRIRIKFTGKNREAEFDDDSSFSLNIPTGDKWADQIVKSFAGLSSHLSAINAAPMPFDPFLLATLAGRKNGYHSTAIHIKKAMCVGAGYDGDPQLLEWLANIETERGLDALFQDTALDMETYGNQFVEVRGGLGVWALYHMPASKCRVILPQIDATGAAIIPEQILQFEYVVRDTGQFWRLIPTYFDLFKAGMLTGVRQMRLGSITGNYWYGEPEYLSAGDLLLTNISIVDYVKKLFEQGTLSDMLLLGKGTNLSKKTRNAFRNFWTASQTGIKNAHRIGFLQVGEGEDITVNKLNAAIDSSFSEQRKDNRDEIVAAHMVPPRVVGIITAGSMGGGGEVEGQLKVLKMSLIDPRQKYYEAQWKQLFRDMGAPMWQTFVFKPLDVTAGSRDVPALSQAVQAGWLSAQEALQVWETEKSADSEAVRLGAALRNFRKELRGG
ncbi:MAG TPA: phage portal protein [Candidatus Kapabacteria bacterium]|jgi:hypothetical protein